MFESAIQRCIYEKLTSDANIIAGSIQVFDCPPQFVSGSQEIYPYILIGDDNFLAWDTDTELGTQVTVTVHTWSRYSGLLETKEIQGFIYQALNRADLIISGFNVILCQHLQSQSFKDSDGLTWHGVQQFNILIQKL